MELNHYIQKIDEKIETLCEELKKIAPENLKELIENLKEFTLRPGKRVRPLLLLLSYNGYKGKNMDDAITFAAAIEIMHSFLLVHDDIIDNADLRRGKPTLHKIYEKSYNSSKLGTDLAIVVGDIVAFYIFGILSELKVSESTLKKIVKNFSKCYVNTGFGQLLDILYAGRIDDKIVKEDIPEKISELKTAYYTFVYPMLFGYYLSENNIEKEEEKILIVGKNAGIAFQYRDDIIGIFGGDAKTLNDLHEGKFTSVIKLTYELLDENDKKIFLNLISKNPKNESDIEKLYELIRKTNSVSVLQDKINTLIEASLKYTEQLTMNEESKSSLKQLISKIKSIPL